MTEFATRMTRSASAGSWEMRRNSSLGEEFSSFTRDRIFPSIDGIVLVR